MAKDDDKDDKKKKARPVFKSLDDLKKGICKEYGDGAVMQGDTIIQVDVFPTGVATIDRALGTGGFPQGRVMEIFGHESSGKTTVCLQIIAACQQHYFANKERHGVAAFIDAEHAFDRDWAAKNGVNTEDLLFCQPNSGEEAFDIAIKMAESGFVDLIVIDSVAALVPMAERDGEVTDHNVGAQGRLMSKGLRVLAPKASVSKTSVVLINQVRQKIGVMYGSPDTTPGGLALKFWASVRAQITKGSPIKEGAEVVGFSPKIKFIKNKCARPFTEAEFDICVGHPERPVCGIDKVASLIKVAEEMEIITLKGSSYSFGDQRLGQGIAKASAAVRNSPEIEAELKEKIYGSFREKLAQAKPVADDEEEQDPLDDDILDNVLDQDE